MKRKYTTYGSVMSRQKKLREAIALIFEEYGSEIVSLVVERLRVEKRVVPSVEWNLSDVEEAVYKFLAREGMGRIEGNIKFYLQMAHAIGKGRNPSELYAQLAQLERVHIEGLG